MSNGVVYTWAKVYVNGQDYGVHEVKISSAIANDLPGRLNFGAGITQRTGKIHWSNAVGKDGLLVSPYRRLGAQGFRLPSHNDRIQIRMGLQQEDPRLVGFEEGELVFTGKVDYSEVSHNGYPVTNIVDDIDRLNRVVRLDAYKHHMPPLVGQADRYRHTGMTPDTVLALLAAKCGFHTTPPPRGVPYVSAKMHGSVVPTPPWGGSIVYAHRTYGDDSNLVTFAGNTQGLALTQAIIDYTSGSRTTRPKIIISACIGAAHKGRAVLHVHLTNGIRLVVIIDEARRVTAQIADTIYPRSTVDLPAEDGYFSVCFDLVAGSVLTSTDRETKVTPTQVIGEQAVSWLTLDASGGSCSISGLNVCGVDAGDSGILGVGFTPSAYIEAGYPYPLHLSRSVRDEKAVDVIEEICAATCCTCHIDGTGKLTIIFGRAAHGKPTQGTLTAKEQVRGYTIKDDSQLAARNVVIKYKTVEGDFTGKGWGSYVTLWEGADKQLNNGEVLEEFIGPGSDEEWFEVNVPFTYANNDDASRDNFLRKNGSFSGFAITSGTAGNKSERWGGGSTTIHQVVPWRWKVRMQPNNACSTHVPEMDGIHPSMWGKGMPVVRGGAYAKLVDAEPYVATGGSTNAADLVHEAGSWVTNTRAADIADYAMKLAKSPLPVIQGLECFFDPRIKVGTRWNLDLTETVGVKLLVFVLAVEHDPASDTTSLDIRVIEDMSPWTWGAIPEKYRSFQAVTKEFSTYELLKAGK